MDTQTSINTQLDDNAGLRIAIEEAKKSLTENALISSTGEVLARSHNLAWQKMSPIFHAEMATFDAAGHVSKAVYHLATLYTTLTPCDMCTGAILWFGVGRVVMGEAKSVGGGGHDILRSRGVEVVDMDNEECYEMLQKFMKDHPDRWKNPSKIACN
ncbi:cytosine deaminase [Morchella snyderi]|nr:cytosine deaminase [Morchella snyderi]